MTAGKTSIILIAALIAFVGLLTFPIWGMGVAVFHDSQRTVLARQTSPDGNRIAQAERLVVGGVPNIVVIVRDWWMPNWYLSGCVAAAHYEETSAAIEWASNNALTITSDDESRFWNVGEAPFHQRSCTKVATTITLRES